MKTADKKLHVKRRKAIIQAARRLFANKGYKETSIQSVANCCKVSKPVIYYYFKNKEALLRAIFDVYWQSMSRIRDEVSFETENFENLLYILARQYLRRFEKAETGETVKIFVSEAPKRLEVRKIYQDIVLGPLLAEALEIMTGLLKHQNRREVELWLAQFTGAIFNYVLNSRIFQYRQGAFNNDEEFLRNVAKQFSSINP